MKKEGTEIINGINSCLKIMLSYPKYYDDLGLNLHYILKISDDLRYLRDEIRRIDKEAK